MTKEEQAEAERINAGLLTTAGIEAMAGRPFTSNQLREAVAEIERLLAAVREADRACALAHAGERACRNEMISANAISAQHIAALERDLSVEVAAGHDTVERAEAAEREVERLRTALLEARQWLSTHCEEPAFDPLKAIIDEAISGKGEL